MNNNLPNSTSIVDDTNVAPDDSGQVQPPAAYSPTPEQPSLTPAAEQVETISPEVNETLPSPEIPAPTPEVVVEEKKEPEQPQVAAPVAPATNIVDKRDHKVEKGTPLESTQKLTEEADEEEEDFIKHVEEIHSIN